MSMIGNTPGVSSQRVITEEVITGSAKAAFTPVGGYSLGYVDVLINGLEVDSNDFTAADGVTVTLATAAAVGDTVKIKAWLPRGLSDGYLKSEADAKFVALTGDQNIAGAKKFTGSVIIGRVNSAEEGGQIDLCRSSDNASAWAIDVFGSTSTPSLRVVDNIASATRMQFDSSGNVEINNGNLKLASGKGIDFSATGNAPVGVMTGEVLNDYEEGYWTPEIVGDSTNGTFTPSYNSARYTKVGRVVHVFCLVGGTLSGAVGAAIVRGLPFNAAFGSQTLSINEQRYTDITGYTQMGFEITNGAPYGYLYMMGISKVESVVNVSKLGSGGTSIFWIAGSYIAS